MQSSLPPQVLVVKSWVHIKAAELLGLHPLELREQLLDRGVPVKIGIESSDRGRAEARAYASTLTLLDACDKLGFRGGRARYHLVTWL